MFALPIFPEERWERRQGRMQRPERVAAVGQMQACFVRRRICRAPQHSPPSILVQMHLTFVHGYKKKASTFVEAFVFALPIFPGSHPPSIVGAHVLNFCVRDGNRWTHITINTNYW